MKIHLGDELANLSRTFFPAALCASAVVAALSIPASVYAGTAPDDGDGVPALTEDGAPNAGDGNSDSILDSLQSNVASLPNGATTGANAGQYLTLVAPAGIQITDVAVDDAPPPFPGGVTDFPVGRLSFRATGTFPAAPALNRFQIIMEAAPSPLISTYWKSLSNVYIPFSSPVPPFGAGATYDGNLTIDLDLIDANVVGNYGETGDLDLNPGVILDPGSPGVNNPLLATVSSLTASAVSGGVQIAWTTSAETDNVGFNVYRNAGITLSKVNSAIIPAEGVDGAGASYSIVDVGGSNAAYYLEDVDLAGTKTLHGPVSVSSLTASVKDWSMFQ